MKRMPRMPVFRNVRECHVLRKEMLLERVRVLRGPCRIKQSQRVRRGLDFADSRRGCCTEDADIKAVSCSSSWYARLALTIRAHCEQVQWRPVRDGQPLRATTPRVIWQPLSF